MDEVGQGHHQSNTKFQVTFFAYLLIQYEIPGDIFAYLLSTDMQNVIGELTCPEDLKRLIDEPKKGALLKRSKYTASDKDFPPMTEMKGCGHLCTASSGKGGVLWEEIQSNDSFSLSSFLLSFLR